LEEFKLVRVDEKLRSYKWNWLRHITRTNNKRMPEIILNYWPNGLRWLGRPLRRLLDEAVAGILRPNSSRIVMIMNRIYYYFLWLCSPAWAMASSFTMFRDHTRRRATVGGTPLDEWSVRRRDLYLTTHNAHNRQTSMPPVGFVPTIAAGERPSTYAFDRAAIWTGDDRHYVL
jgi:hypothetical protein